MAEMATYIGIAPRTAIADPANANIPRGSRVNLQANGYIALQDATAIGDFITITDVIQGKPGEVASLWGGGKCAVIAAVAVAAGDPAYTAANGQATNVATGATLFGKFTQPASGAGVLTEVELKN